MHGNKKWRWAKFGAGVMVGVQTYNTFQISCTFDSENPKIFFTAANHARESKKNLAMARVHFHVAKVHFSADHNTLNSRI